MITPVKAYEVDGVVRRNIITPIQEKVPHNRDRSFGGSGDSGLHDRWFNNTREVQNKFVVRIYNPLKRLFRETAVNLIEAKIKPLIEPKNKKKK